MPPIIGMQIIGDNVFLMNLLAARIRNIPSFKSPLYIKSQSIAKFFTDYHEALWKEIGSKKEGVTLYDGGIENDDGYIDEMFKMIKEKISDETTNPIVEKESKNRLRNFIHSVMKKFISAKKKEVTP